MRPTARRLHERLGDRLRHMPAVVLLGPRQVGKTTLARQIARQRKTGAVYLDLERPVDQRRLSDADAFLRAQGGKLVIIDEIHRAPALFDTLRGIIDDRRAAGQREDGAEIDLIFERGGAIEIAIEIKRSTAPDVTKGFRLACDTLRPKAAYVVHGGDETWNIDKHTLAVPLTGLMRRLIEA